MDTAANDKNIKGDESKLRSINACRLYHGVIYPNDKSVYTSTQIRDIYLFRIGSNRKAEQVGWPEQPLPLTHQWT